MDPFREVADEFDLPYVEGDVRNQDWELRVADPDKLELFIDGLKRFQGSSRVALVGVILASFQESEDEENFSDLLWARFWQDFREDIAPVIYLLETWIDLGDDTPRMVDLRLRESLATEGYSVVREGRLTRIQKADSPGGADEGGDAG